MKGSAMLVVFMILAIVVAIVVGFGLRINLFGGGEGVVHKTSLQSNIYVMGHALDAAGLYMDTALDYSVYQACYDNLQRAGQSHITEETGKDGYGYLLDMDSEEFHDELREEIETFMNRYTTSSYTFMSDYKVVLPTPQIAVSHSGDAFSASALTTDKLTITKVAESSETITLRSSLDSSGTYTVPCYSLYLKGTELNPDIVSTVDSAITQATAEISEMIENSETSCNSNGLCSDLTDKMQTYLIDIGSGFPQETGYTITSDILDASVSITSIDSGNIIGYNVKVTQKVTVNETSPNSDRFYPVWNGTHISFETMELVFINTAEKTVALPSKP